MTKQRELILEIINQNKRHLTADEIYVLAKFKMPSIAMATIYNNLNALNDAGIIKRVHIDGAADHFDKVTTPHDYLLCDKCGKVENIVIPYLQQSIENAVGDKINGHEMIIHYVCPECKNGK